MIVYKYVLLSYKRVYALVFFRISADVPCVVLHVSGLRNPARNALTKRFSAQDNFHHRILDLMYNILSLCYKTIVLSAVLNNAITLNKESIYLRTTYFDDISPHLGIESLTP